MAASDSSESGNSGGTMEERGHHPHSPSTWAKIKKCSLYKSDPAPSKYALIGTQSHELLEEKLKSYNESVRKNNIE